MCDLSVSNKIFKMYWLPSTVSHKIKGKQVGRGPRILSPCSLPSLSVSPLLSGLQQGAVGFHSPLMMSSVKLLPRGQGEVNASNSDLKRSSMLNKNDNNNATLSWGTKHVLFSPCAYVLCFINTCKFCFKCFGGVLFYPLGQTRLTERRNHLGTADDHTLCPFLPCNPRFVGVHISQGNVGLKK